MKNVLLTYLMGLAPHLCKFAAEGAHIRPSLAGRAMGQEEDINTLLKRPSRMLNRDMNKVDRALAQQTDGSNLTEDLKNPQVLKGTSVRTMKGTDPKLDKQVENVQKIYNSV